MRVRRIGGKTLVWGRASWRLSDFEFKAQRSRRLRRKLAGPLPGNCAVLRSARTALPRGRPQGGLPQIPDGNFLEDNSPDSESDRSDSSAPRKSRNIPTTKPRRATGTLASSVNLLLPDALATGNLHDRAQCGGARNHRRQEYRSGERREFRGPGTRSRELHAKARVLVVGASALESTRLLLNSGIANSSGVLGHYFFDQFYVQERGAGCSCRKLATARPGADLMGGAAIFRASAISDTKEKDFIRGYAWISAAAELPARNISRFTARRCKRNWRRISGRRFTMTTMGEVLPRYENYVAHRPEGGDAWGIPALHIQPKYTDNEFKMAQGCHETLDGIVPRRRVSKCWRSTIRWCRPARAFTNSVRAGWATIPRPPY